MLGWVLTFPVIHMVKDHILIITMRPAQKNIFMIPQLASDAPLIFSMIVSNISLK